MRKKKVDVTGDHAGASEESRDIIRCYSVMLHIHLNIIFTSVQRLSYACLDKKFTQISRTSLRQSVAEMSS